MVDIDKIRHKIYIIEDNLNKLEKLSSLSQEDFLSDFRNNESAKHLLQVAIECMSDIANHIIARNRLGNPETTAEGFRILNENNIISTESLPGYIQMIKFRNKLVHLYTEIKNEQIYTILKNNLSNFESFISQILEFTH